MPTPTIQDRYIVRVGDDGRPKSRQATLGEAREAARELSLVRLRCAQIIDTADGWRETWRNGVCIGGHRAAWS